MRGCARFLFNHNPFYPISAALIMVGLREAMQSWEASTSGAWWLAGWLAAYTVLLAVTAVVIIRAGKVWDDARTICLLVVLMLMAMSSSFDTLCVEHPNVAAGVLSVGWLFSVVITEGLTRTAGFRFPWLYRAPFYALLGLFFGFPVLVNADWWSHWSISQAGRVLSFSTLAAVLMLTLIPAIGRGADYVNRNGSPWCWPLYPWSVFFIIVVGICGRAYLLTLSFQNDQGYQSSFGGYYLIPLVLAILILLTEIAVVHKLQVLQPWLMVAPWVLVLLAELPGTSNAYQLFLYKVIQSIGSPLWISLNLSFVFLIYLGMRKFVGYQAAMIPVLIALIGVGPSTSTLAEYTPQQYWPIGLFAAYQLVMLWRKPTAMRLSIVWTMTVAAAAIHWRDTWFTRDSGILPWHLILLGVWVSCIIFKDEWAMYWRRRLPVICLGLASVAGALWLGSGSSLWRWWIGGYMGLLLTLAVFSWLYLHMKLWKWCAISMVAGMAMVGTLAASRNWQSNLPRRAIQSLVLGAASFAIGGAISASKAGLTRGTQSRIKREWQAVALEWNGLQSIEPQ